MDFIAKNWEHILAALGAVSIFLHALEAGCNAAGWTEYAGIFQKFSAFIQGFLGGFKPPDPPSAPTKAAIFLALVLLVTPTFAQSTSSPVPSTQSPASITQALNALGFQTGYAFGFRSGHGYAYQATKLAIISEKYGVSLDGGLIATSGLGVSIDEDLMKTLSLKKYPIIGFFDTCKVGVIGFATDITAYSNGSQINKVDNRIDGGFDALISKKF